MYITGLINALDAKAMKARVQFPDKEGLVSPWLPVVTAFAQANRSYRMPDLGEQVACLMDDNLESGCIVGSVYGGSETPPEESGDIIAVHFSDGTIIRYDRKEKTLTVQCVGKVLVEAAEKIGMAAPEILFRAAAGLNMNALVGGWKFDDGTKIEYNQITKVLDVLSIGDLIVEVMRAFSMTVPVLNFICSGASNLQAGGPVTVNAGGPVTVNAGGPINLNAPGVFANGKPIG